MRPEQQESSESERAETPTETVSVRVTPSQKRALFALADIHTNPGRTVTVSDLLQERAVQPLVVEYRKWIDDARQAALAQAAA